MLYFPQSCGYTWGLYLVVKMVGNISQFTICVARFLISHVRFYPPFMLLLDVTLPLLFSELGKICIQNLENITWRVVWFNFTKQSWSWNYNKCRKTCSIFIIHFLAHLTQRVMWAIAITWRPSSSYVVNFLKNLLLWKWKYKTNGNQTWSESSLGCLVSKLCPVMPCTNQHGHCYWK